MLGALLAEPVNPDSVAGVIFFNNVGCLNGCLHGTMGVAVTLLRQRRVGLGEHQFDAPVGPVTAHLAEGGDVTVRNVRSYRSRKDVSVEWPGMGEVTGDMTWGVTGFS